VPSDLLESVLVERIVWPVRLKPLAPDGCDSLTPSHILVREDGEPATVTEIERHDLPTLHVLLIDTSGSMMGLFTYTRSAAEEYIRALPAGDRVMLATFDEDMRLWVPPTVDRNLILDALDRITVHPDHNTALWDAVDNTLHYLQWEDSRKVLVLLTDGCDSLSLPAHNYDATLERAITARRLTIFPVAMGNRPFPGARSPSCFVAQRGKSLPSPRNILEPLARRTGGELIISQGDLGMSRAFRQILKRLSQEAAITYSALPFGEGPQDKVRKGHRWRRVRVEGSDIDTCRVSSAGPPQRRVQPHALPTPPPSADIFEDHEGLKVAELEDVVLSRGQLYDEQAYLTAGRMTLEMDRDPLMGTREAGVMIPPFTAPQAMAGQPHLLLEALLKLCRDPQDCLNPSGRVLPFVYGQSFFDLRPHLGRLLLAQPGYGEWARAGIRAERLEQIERLLDEAGDDLSTQARTQVRETLLNRPLSAREVQSHLSLWLGDVSAADLAADLEVQASLDATTRRRLRRQWPLLAVWFQPPTRTRTLTLLVPGYDRRREAFGFYRIHLPGTRRGLPEDLIPPRPMATRILDWAHGPDGLSLLRRQPHRLVAVRYHPPPDPQVVVTLLRSRGMPRRLAAQEQGWSVTMRIAPVDEDGDTSRHLILQGYFILGAVLPREQSATAADPRPAGWEDLFCLVPPVDTGGATLKDPQHDLTTAQRLCSPTAQLPDSN